MESLKRAGLLILWFGMLSMVPSGVGAADDAEPARRTVERWLVLGPSNAALPVFHEDGEDEFGLAELLAAPALPSRARRPRAGATLTWAGGETLTWAETVASDEGSIEFASGDGIRQAVLAATLTVQRFTSLVLIVESHHLLSVHVDGKEVATKKKATTKPSDEPENGKKGKRKKKDPIEPGEARASLDLEPGAHRILVRTLQDPDCLEPWGIAARVEVEEPNLLNGLTVNSSTVHLLELAQILDAPQPSGVSLSPDGTLVAITVRRVRAGTHDSESWVEIRRTKDGALERTYRGGDLSSLDWAPGGQRLSYVTGDGDTSTLWVANLESGEVHPVLEEVERLGSYRWTPDGESVIYSISVKAPEHEAGMHRLQGLRDRQQGAGRRSYLYQVFVAGGARRRLTAGDLSTSLGNISPDGSRLLFRRTMDDYTERPFVRSELNLLHLESLEVELLSPGQWIGDASWSPDGSRLLVVAGPSAFDGAGAAVAEGAIPNDYDNQLYLFDLADRQATPVSREFDPAVGRAVWHRGSGQIVLSATEGSRRRFFRLDPESLVYTALESGVDVVGSWDLSHESSVLAFIGSGASLPPRVAVLDVVQGSARVISFPGEEAFADVRLGKVEPWSFTSRRGVTIEGRVYYPPDFDPGETYPAIVYYYGGTVPTTRDFGGRYPKNLWAAHGYVIYVLQPSGAIGYGQKFSSLHVNDWGRIAGDDILEGVDKFLEAHGFVDPERLGCIGASYGGFMTQYLLTRTERFAAGISHAGISSLSSYWGEGYWGYSYSGVATAGSYPWNRGDLYIGQSPLFNADKITTPLLLLHGTGDTNVPPGESEQLYTALKLLDRPVEYVRIEGQNHHILKHEQRILWSQTIVAWFDQQLKDEPAWWDHLYPAPGRKKKE